MLVAVRLTAYQPPSPLPSPSPLVLASTTYFFIMFVHLLAFCFVYVSQVICTSFELPVLFKLWETCHKSYIYYNNV